MRSGISLNGLIVVVANGNNRFTAKPMIINTAKLKLTEYKTNSKGFNAFKRSANTKSIPGKKEQYDTSKKLSAKFTGVKKCTIKTVIALRMRMKNLFIFIISIKLF